MAKFRKKPIIVEASQWFKHGDCNVFSEDHFSDLICCKECGKLLSEHGWIDTLEGRHRVCPGDWIITGIKGEKYPIKDEILKLTYDKVDE